MLKRIALLALLAACLASAKNYTFIVREATQAGSVELKPGEYTVKVASSQVVLVDNDGHRIDVAATVEATDRKFDQTSVWTLKTDGINRLESIELGGSNNKVVFQ